MQQRDQPGRGAAAIVRICRVANGLLLVAIAAGLIRTGAVPSFYRDMLVGAAPMVDVPAALLGVQMLMVIGGAMTIATDRLPVPLAAIVAGAEQGDPSTPSGWLLFHILALVAEMKRELVKERMIAGLAAARARGGNGGGRKSAMTSDKIDTARKLLAAGDKSAKIAKLLQVGLSSFYRHCPGAAVFPDRESAFVQESADVILTLGDLLFANDRQEPNIKWA